MTDIIMQQQHAAVRAYLSAGPKWDADTMEILDGCEVWAETDADKTFAGPDPVRYFVGYIDELLADGAPEGVVLAASEAADETDRLQVVGFDPYFGWIFRDIEDTNAASLTRSFRVDSSGPVETYQARA